MGAMPDFSIKILDKSNNRKSTVGAGWKKSDGSISLSIDPGCSIPYDPNFVISLFPVGARPRQGLAGRQPRPPGPSEDFHDGQDPPVPDDIPY